MRIIAQNVEYYALMRDHPAFSLGPENSLAPQTPSGGALIDRHSGQNLGDSLWYFDGNGIKVWVDVQDFLSPDPAELGREAPNPVHVAVDFYPLSILLNKGIVFGVEPELLQRRDGSFAVQRFTTRVRRKSPIEMQADAYRLIYFYPRSYDTIFRTLTHRRPYTYHTTIKPCHISHMRLKSCSMTYWMRR